MASFLWLKASITDINTTDVAIKLFFPFNIEPLTVAIHHYSIIDSLSILTFIRLNF